jgi:uncharacterized membrane protein
MSTTTCSQCGVTLQPADVLYTADARVVCQKCYALGDIVETDKRAAHNIRNAAIACAVLGVLSFFSPLSGFMVVVIGCVVATFVSGIYAIQSLARGNERFTRHLTGGDRILIWFCCIFGFLIAGLMGLAVLGVSQLMFL